MRKRSRASTSPSSRPSRRTREPAWGSRPCTASSSRAAEKSSSRVSSVRGRPSPCFFRWSRRTHVHDPAPASDEARLRAALDALEAERGKRLAAEEALRLAEERYQLAMSASDDVIWDWTLDDDFVLASASFSRLVGADAVADHDGALLRIPVDQW